MPEQPTGESVHAWHRRFVVEANNRAWRLSEKTELATDEGTDYFSDPYGHQLEVTTYDYDETSARLAGRWAT